MNYKIGMYCRKDVAYNVSTQKKTNYNKLKLLKKLKN